VTVLSGTAHPIADEFYDHPFKYDFTNIVLGHVPDNLFDFIFDLIEVVKVEFLVDSPSYVVYQGWGFELPAHRRFVINVCLPRHLADTWGNLCIIFSPKIINNDLEKSLSTTISVSSPYRVQKPNTKAEYNISNIYSCSKKL